MSSPADALSHFARTADVLASTSSRLEKAALFAAYCATLEDEPLALAVRYFAGHVFAAWDERVLQIGGAAMLGALSELSDVAQESLKPQWVAAGDLGELAATVLPERPASLRLQDAADAFARLAATRGPKAKRDALVALLARATPQEAKYLFKLIGDSMRIGFLEGAVEDAVARAAGVPVAEVAAANMLLGDIGETAVRARHGRLAGVEMRLFHPLKFMLASPAPEVDDVARAMPQGFVVEDKFDGIRCQAHASPASRDAPSARGVVHEGIRVALFSRTLDEITSSFLDLVPAIAAAVGDAAHGTPFILDGEIVPVSGAAVLPFQTLQTRLGRKAPSAEVRAATPVALIAYDLLYHDGALVIDQPLHSRRALLESIVTAESDASILRRAASVQMVDTANLDAAFDAARARGNEGLMVKNPTSPYKPGRRGRDWLKIKRALATLDVVVTAVEVGNGKRRHLLSDYTFAVRQSREDPTLLNIGKAYSGLTDAELATMSEWFRAHTLQQFGHGKVRVVEPQVVVEVTFDRVQASSRHKSGYALRFPRIVRLRPDKPASEIDTLEAVRKLVT